MPLDRDRPEASPPFVHAVGKPGLDPHRLPLEGERPQRWRYFAASYGAPLLLMSTLGFAMVLLPSIRRERAADRSQALLRGELEVEGGLFRRILGSSAVDARSVSEQIFRWVQEEDRQACRYLDVVLELPVLIETTASALASEGEFVAAEDLRRLYEDGFRAKAAATYLRDPSSQSLRQLKPTLVSWFVSYARRLAVRRRTGNG